MSEQKEPEFVDVLAWFIADSVRQGTSEDIRPSAQCEANRTRT